MNHLNLIIMDTLKFISIVFISFLFIGCNNNEYYDDNNAFHSIYLLEWNSSICPKKIIFKKYNKNSNFKTLIETSTDFEIQCYTQYDKFNNKITTPNSTKLREFIPNFKNNDKINYDVKLIIDDSLEYKITNIENIKDTIVKTFTLARKYFISNTIKSITVNGHKMNNDSRSLEIPSSLGRKIK